MKEANLKRQQSIWFQLYNIIEKAKLWRQVKRVSDCYGLLAMIAMGDEQVEHRGILGQWKYSEWQCNHEYVLLYFCSSV